VERVVIVGAGLTGAVIARELADAGLACLVIDERAHVAGNCHTERDSSSGILVHVYGPHIFHTAKPRVWELVNRFAEMTPFILRVKATVRGRVYGLPVNLHTINQFFNQAMSPGDARAFLATRTMSGDGEARTLEELALRQLGPELYEGFFRGYTRKQWGIDPALLPASVLKRLPLRFDYNDAYFDDPWQAMPRGGYTDMVAGMLDHDRIELRLGCRFEELSERAAHVFYSGGMDRYFGYDLGRLSYRTLDFRASRHRGDFQGNAIMNHPDEDVPFTRVTEHRHLSPWETPTRGETVVFHEYSRDCGAADIPFYPVNLAAGSKLLAAYQERSAAEAGVTFVGRLGTYQYLNMDAAIDLALDAAHHYLDRRKDAPQ